MKRPRVSSVESDELPDEINNDKLVEQDSDHNNLHAEPAIYIASTRLIDPRSRNCPYLDTINRSMLDFDFEKLCSISLSNNNVYACLVCGKYFQGRGQRSHAYTHSVEVSHRVFMNLATLKFYCLPDNYEVIDSSLDDIKYVSNPTYTDSMISLLDQNAKSCRALTGSLYYPGIMGLNNIKSNDYCNVVFFALSHVKPIRDFFLRDSNYEQLKYKPADSAAVLILRFGELIRKMWNPRNFKPHVSPHEMLQAVVSCSKKRFQIIEQGDPVKVMTWLLNTMHKAMKKMKSPNNRIITNTFQGKMRVFQRRVLVGDVDNLNSNELHEFTDTCQDQCFLCLSVDLPPPPLFQDENKQNIIPQVPLFSILSKFDGETEHEYKTYKENYMRRYEIQSLPPYVILYFQRFTMNNFYLEKNNTIVNFPIRNVDFGTILNVTGADKDGNKNISYHYNLIANIVHEGQPESDKGTYRAHIIHKPTGTWYEMQDLHVNVFLPQMITLSESYMQIWEKCELY
ncbi:hypothetical protein GJ496_007316 [Pomphorhynchus laevis]|nr:hypothetical protein GJ496_007316 [Pomphorhynchus laevis]